VDTYFPHSFPDVAPPTHPLGQILGVRGSEARVALPAPAFLEQSRATVGAFLCISAGPRRLIGMITEVESIEPSQPGARGFGAVARVDLMGEIVLEARDVASFARGVSIYPAIGDPADIIGPDELRLIYANTGEPSISIGSLHHDETIEARVSLDNFDAGQGQERAFVKLVVERWRAASGGPRSIADEPTAAEMEARAEPQPGPTHDRPEPDVPSRALPTSAFSRIEQIRAQMLRRGRTSNA
jgi:hypothetical protein